MAAVSNWPQPHRELFEEALKTMPGLLACRERKDHAGSRVLMQDLVDHGEQAGITGCVAWSIFYNAAMHWFLQTTYALAKKRDMSFEEITQEMTLLAAMWESDVV